MNIPVLEIISMGKEAGKALNKALDMLPTHDQRALKGFFKFLDGYNEEMSRVDSDFDTLLLYKERRKILLDTVIKELNEKNN